VAEVHGVAGARPLQPVAVRAAAQDRGEAIRVGDVDGAVRVLRPFMPGRAGPGDGSGTPSRLKVGVELRLFLRGSLEVGAW
jgi:hypothetical protein